MLQKVFSSTDICFKGGLAAMKQRGTWKESCSCPPACGNSCVHSWAVAIPYYDYLFTPGNSGKQAVAFNTTAFKYSLLLPAVPEKIGWYVISGKQLTSTLFMTPAITDASSFTISLNCDSQWMGTCVWWLTPTSFKNVTPVEFHISFQAKPYDKSKDIQKPSE